MFALQWNSQTRNKLVLYLALLIVVMAFSIFTFVPNKSPGNKFFIFGRGTAEDFSKPPPLPNWASIPVKAVRKTLLKTSNDDGYKISPIESEVSLLPLSVEKAHSLRWIVVTSIHYPTRAIEKLSKLKGWALVLVADVKTPKNWSHPNCVFLSIESQKSLLFETHNIIPYHQYGRKTIGYLYAIQHGAEMIYETDDDNELISGIEKQVLAFQDNCTSNKAYFLPAHSQQIDTFISKPVFRMRAGGTSISTNATDSPMTEEQITVNPYHHFGQRTLWPRGYPLRLVGDEIPININVSTVRPLIQQGLANGDPDMDAIFRLTRSNRHKAIEIQFQQKPPVAVSHGLLVPFNSQNTLFHYDAFWALWIPITTTFRVCDIWRGYFAQRLLWEVKPPATLTFHSPSVLQIRNSHNYLLDFEEELQLYVQAEKLIIFLRKWNCLHGGSHLNGLRDCEVFFNKIYFLAVDMAEAGFWKMKEAWLCRSFLIDLVTGGYKHTSDYQIPAMRPRSANQRRNSALQNSQLMNESEEKSNRVIQTTNNFTSDSNNVHVTSSTHSAPTRVAVCVSGQPRTLNMVLPSVLSVMTVDQKAFAEGSTWRKSAFVNQTTANNIQNMLFSRLPTFDVFMYVATKEKHFREPKVNDTTICESLRPRSSSNGLFCSVEREMNITNPSTSLTVFDTYTYAGNQRLTQGLLQQLNGLLQCNAMRKEHSRKTGTQYTHWIRLRPDGVFLDYFPNITEMHFLDKSNQQPIVTYATKTKCCCGNEDSFGVGTIDTMNAYFDRINILNTYKRESRWSAEMFATYALKVTANAQLLDNDPMVQACVYKPPDRRAVGDP